MPPLAGVVVGLATPTVAVSWHSLLAGQMLPLLASLPALSTVGPDPARELHATAPHPYTCTVGCRIATAGAAIAAAIVLATGIGALLGQVANPASFAILAVCSALFLVGIGAVVAASSRSTAAASSAVLAVWLGQLLVGERILGAGAARLLVPALVGCAALLLALYRVGSRKHVVGDAIPPRIGS